MWIIKLLLFGLAVGILARLFHPGRDKMNILWTILLGIWGSILGGWIGTLLQIDAEVGLRRWVAATLGAIVLLVTYGLFVRRPQQGARRRA
jgi:uncharacterized membrane protein YeaQ/YmgE (transglycosylase-associated protein family)